MDIKIPLWTDYFMDIAELVKTKSTCLRRQVGAVIVKDRRVIATGYNGSPKGCRHCSETGCLRQKLNIPSGEKLDLCRAVHAEENAILQSARYGISVEGADLYTTLQPCTMCAKSIINSGISRVIFRGDYPNEMAIQLLKEAGVSLVLHDIEPAKVMRAKARFGESGLLECCSQMCTIECPDFNKCMEYKTTIECCKGNLRGI
jgi:dCMP deaminase